MLRPAFVFALTVITAAVWLSPQAATAPAGRGQSPWLRTESQRFEIHYVPALSGELDRVVRSAERAYDRVSGQLNFVLATKVPLVVFTPSGPMTREQVRAYSTSDQVAPPQPHRSRIVLPLVEGDTELDALIVHELTHLLVSEIVLPGRGGDGGVPRWVHEGAASYMAGVWRDDDERLMRELVASGEVPALSQLTGNGGFADARLNEALGRVAFDYIESRWGATSIRRFLNALIVPRVDRTYNAVFDLTPGEFDAAFRQYAQRRFRPVVRIRCRLLLRPPSEATKGAHHYAGIRSTPSCLNQTATGLQLAKDSGSPLESRKKRSATNVQQIRGRCAVVGDASGGSDQKVAKIVPDTQPARPQGAPVPTLYERKFGAKSYRAPFEPASHHRHPLCRSLSNSRTRAGPQGQAPGLRER